MRTWNEMKGSLVTGKPEGMLMFILLLRAILVLFVLIALPLRITLPGRMSDSFRYVAYPLFLYSFVPLLVHKKAAAFLHRYAGVLFLDLLISAAILLIGGGWRSSYFAYTITTILLFTVFRRKKGACISALGLSVTALLKDPSGDLPSMEIFLVTEWDMRVGTSSFYIFSGVILGYISTLWQKQEALVKAREKEIRKVTAMKERSRLALTLHDSAKQMVNAILFRMSPLVKQATSGSDIVGELRWHYRALMYLQEELNEVMATLKGEIHESGLMCNIENVATDEAKIVEEITGSSWQIKALQAHEMNISLRYRQPLRRFFSEALMNAWKHSGEKKGIIELKRINESIVVTISDHGNGFILSEAEDTETVGLKSLQHRASELHGELNIETAPDHGCRIILTISADKK